MGESRVEIVRDDLTRDFFQAASASGLVAWDIETSGLEWQTSRIGTCQLAIPGHTVIAVLRDERAPKYLTALLEDETVTKVFHHAPFDLRFMAYHWHAVPAQVACTKIASKILNPELESGRHSLKTVLQTHLGVVISKAQQVSDWLAPSLTEAQLEYAASDVAHLLDLYEVLRRKVGEAGVAHQLSESYRYLPTRVLLDLRGAGDVFAY